MSWDPLVVVESAAACDELYLWRPSVDEVFRAIDVESLLARTRLLNAHVEMVSKYNAVFVEHVGPNDDHWCLQKVENLLELQGQERTSASEERKKATWAGAAIRSVAIGDVEQKLQSVRDDDDVTQANLKASSTLAREKPVQVSSLDWRE